VAELVRSALIVAITITLASPLVRGARADEPAAPVPCSAYGATNPAAQLQRTLRAGSTQSIECLVEDAEAARVTLSIEDPQAVDVDLFVSASDVRGPRSECASTGTGFEEGCSLAGLTPGRSRLSIVMEGLGDPGTDYATAVRLSVQGIAGPLLEATTLPTASASPVGLGETRRVVLTDVHRDTPGAPPAALAFRPSEVDEADGFILRVDHDPPLEGSVRLVLHDTAGAFVQVVPAPLGEYVWVDHPPDGIIRVDSSDLPPWFIERLSLSVLAPDQPLPYRLSSERSLRGEVATSRTIRIEGDGPRLVSLLHTDACTLSPIRGVILPRVRSAADGDEIATRVVAGSLSSRWGGLVEPEDPPAGMELTLSPPERRNCSFRLASTTGHYLDSYATGERIFDRTSASLGFGAGLGRGSENLRLQLGQDSLATSRIDASTITTLLGRRDRAAGDGEAVELRISAPERGFALVLTDRFGRVLEGPTRRLLLDARRIDGDALLSVIRDQDVVLSERRTDVILSRRTVRPFIWPN
jgi:hypothetical protein